MSECKVSACYCDKLSDPDEACEVCKRAVLELLADMAEEENERLRDIEEQRIRRNARIFSGAVKARRMERETAARRSIERHDCKRIRLDGRRLARDWRKVEAFISDVPGLQHALRQAQEYRDREEAQAQELAPVFFDVAGRADAFDVPDSIAEAYRDAIEPAE